MVMCMAIHKNMVRLACFSYIRCKFVEVNKEIHRDSQQQTSVTCQLIN